MSNPKGINQYSSRNAAAARTMHSQAQKDFRRQGAFNISSDISRSARKEIANQLRRLRKPSLLPDGRHSEMTIHEIVSNAVASARLRNLRKNGKTR